MAVLLATFRTRFPEMASAPDTLVQATLDEAGRSLDSSELGARYDDAAYYYAAHLLATSPGGLMARLASKEGESTYLDRYRQIAREVCGGPAYV